MFDFDKLAQDKVFRPGIVRWSAIVIGFLAITFELADVILPEAKPPLSTFRTVYEQAKTVILKGGLVALALFALAFLVNAIQNLQIVFDTNSTTQKILGLVLNIPRSRAQVVNPRMDIQFRDLLKGAQYIWAYNPPLDLVATEEFSENREIYYELCKDKDFEYRMILSEEGAANLVQMYDLILTVHPDFHHSSVQGNKPQGQPISMESMPPEKRFRVKLAGKKLYTVETLEFNKCENYEERDLRFAELRGISYFLIEKRRGGDAGHIKSILLYVWGEPFSSGEQFPKVDDFLWADKALKETVPSACFELAAQM